LWFVFNVFSRVSLVCFRGKSVTHASSLLPRVRSSPDGLPSKLEHRPLAIPELVLKKSIWHQRPYARIQMWSMGSAAHTF
jgi:hypothetical protein